MIFSGLPSLPVQTTGATPNRTIRRDAPYPAGQPKALSPSGRTSPVGRALTAGMTFGWNRVLDWGREHPVQAAGVMTGLAATPVLCPHFAGVLAAGMAMRLAGTLR